MGDEPGKEQNRSGDVEIGRRGVALMQGIPDMIDGHDQHDEPPQ